MNTVRVTLTAREVNMIIRALTIAAEDGSIYGTAETDAEIAAINAEMEAIEAKLTQVRIA